MSSAQQRFIVNAGTDSAHQIFGRSTAAHSTVAINDTSSCRFGSNSKIASKLGVPILAGPSQIKLRRLDDKRRQGFVARHDGYLASFGLICERKIFLSHGGRIVEGRDHFIFPSKKNMQKKQPLSAVARFHIHPSIDISLSREGHILLGGGRGEIWRFICDEVKPELEDSIFFADNRGKVKTQQIVLSFSLEDLLAIHWRFNKSTHVSI